MTIKQHVLQILIAFDQLINAILLGYADETISSRMYRFEQNDNIIGKIFRPIIDMLFWFEHQHCKNSYISEQLRSHMPRNLR